MAGRNFEYLGEDPYLASAYRSLVEGSRSGVIATIKHFAATIKNTTAKKSARIWTREGCGKLLPAFEAAVREAKAADHGRIQPGERYSHDENRHLKMKS